MIAYLLFFIEAFIFCTLVLKLTDLLWDWFVKEPPTDTVKKMTKARGWGWLIWCLFVLLKYSVFWFDEGDSNNRRIPAQYPYIVENGKTGIYLLNKDKNDVLNCEIAQFAISGSKFYYTCEGKESDVRIFDFDSKTVRTANSGPVLRSFSPQYNWYHYGKIDLAGIVLFAVIQFFIMIILQKSRPKK